MLPKVREEFERLWSRKRKELLERGFPEGLVDKAKEFIEDYVQGYSTKYFREAPPEELERIQRMMLDDALRMAEHWVKSLTEVFAPTLAKKLETAVKL